MATNQSLRHLAVTNGGFRCALPTLRTVLMIAVVVIARLTRRHLRIADSLAYAAINPAIGLGSFLAQFLLRQPLQSAGTQQFHITGSWADPQVAKVEREPPASPPRPMQ